ncbi:MAG: hypothetical protein ABIT38_24695 [Gemmatimonadaceae bacterium]
MTERAKGNRAAVRFDFAAGTSRVLWKGCARLADVTSDAGHTSAVAGYEDVATPPDIHRLSSAFARGERITRIEPRLDSVSTGTAEIFETRIPAYNGKLSTVRTAVLLPPGARRGDKLPAVVALGFACSHRGSRRDRSPQVVGGNDAWWIDLRRTVSNRRQLLLRRRERRRLVPHYRSRRARAA